jgi:sugar O-acyltransferase (sialic acid O-acetyltransferase NeuD family)
MSLTDSGLVIYGCGGHARSVADVAMNDGVKQILFIDKQAREGERIFGFDVFASLDAIPSGWGVICAQGDNAQREQTIQQLQKSSRLVNIISNTATIGVDSLIEQGCFIGHHAHAGPASIIGIGCILNTASVVEHDCEVGHFTHISVHATLCGKVKIGQRCFIGAGATVIDGISICDDVMVGAGSVVVNDITEPGVYLGVPACRKN